jgi:hypothetical protein
MFTPTSFEKIGAAFPGPEYGNLYAPPAKHVRRLYLEHGPSAGVARRRWDDAEVFLDALNKAAASPTGSPPRKSMEALVKASGYEPATEVGSVSVAAQRLLAAECCQFLVAADLTSEGWDPYRRWAQRIETDDTVISFNYDLVVEKAMAQIGHDARLQVVFPGDERDASRVSLLKLHGSVDWRCSGSKYTREREDFALIGVDGEIVIGSPGPDKRKTTKNLDWLWKKAEVALQEASAVVFLGYRFPATDSEARRRLLNAIGSNKARGLVLHTVLGPHKEDGATVCLQRMLEWVGETRPGAPGVTMVGSRCQVAVHPLWVQDFLDLYDPRTLHKRGHLP